MKIGPAEVQICKACLRAIVAEEAEREKARGANLLRSAKKSPKLKQKRDLTDGNAAT